MTARSSRLDPPTPQPLSSRTIAGWALGVLVVAAVVSFVLLRHYGDQEARVQLDAIRTAGTLVIGTGGAVALLLTARRQRYIELTLVHTDRDATERRITELYTKAADQLGSDQAPVRLAGLYALERLAHSTVEHRQTMVDVICAYLRMPYTPPQPSVSKQGRSYRSLGPARRRRARTLTDRPPHLTPISQGSRQERAQQEQQVRLTAQNILIRNLRVTSRTKPLDYPRPPSEGPAWPGIHLNLTGALLVEYDLSWCDPHDGDFARTQFTGSADFTRVWFSGRADFVNAQFACRADFRGAQFTPMADFQGVKFTNDADFTGAEFTREAFFADALFTGRADFRGAEFNKVIRKTYLSITESISSRAYFVRAQFNSRADFGDALFTDGADFTDAQFADEVDFEGARVASAATLLSVWPPGWTTRPAEPDNGEDPAFLYLTKLEEGHPPDA